MTYIDDLGNFLTALGYTPIFYFYSDKSTPNSITIAQYGGSEKTPATGEKITQPNIQIMVRNSDLSTAYTTATNIYTLFRNIYNSKIGNTRFMKIEPKSPPMYAGTSPETGLHHFSINFSILF